MKKLLTILFSLILCGFCFAEESNNNNSEQNEFIFGFDTGIFGIGISYGTGNTFSFDINASLANIYFENISTGLGIEFFPINYFYSTNTNEHMLSFSKLYLYWNLNEILGLNIGAKNDEGIILGPFLSIQTLNLINFESFNTNISYSAGIKFARKLFYIETGNNRISFFSANIELGYNYNNNRHNIYFTIGLNPLVTLVFPFAYLYFAIFDVHD